jgi:hypothetical protein
MLCLLLTTTCDAVLQVLLPLFVQPLKALILLAMITLQLLILVIRSIILRLIPTVCLASTITTTLFLPHIPRRCHLALCSNRAHHNEPNLAVRKKRFSTATRRHTSDRHIADVFCGTAGLSNSLSGIGFQVVCSVDLLRGPLKLDLANDADYVTLCHFQECGALVYIHLGAPCSSFSQAPRGASRKRSRANPCGPCDDHKIAAANKLVDRTLDLILALHRRGVYWSLENPRGSLL